MPGFLIEHGFATALLGAFAGGSSVTLFFALAAGQGFFPLPELCAGAALGNLCSDLTWFVLGRYVVDRKRLGPKRVQRGFALARSIWEQYDRMGPVVLILAKFMYGLRVVTVVFFSRMDYPLRRFLAFDSLAVVVITLVIVGSGWAAGRGSRMFLDLFGSLSVALTATLAAWLIYSGGCLLLRRKLSTRARLPLRGQKR